MAKNNSKLLVATAIISIVIGVFVRPQLHLDDDNDLVGNMQSSEESSSADEPLYWVAPMDDNYRRDKPGQSPMGMDLVPVYATESQASFGEGAVKITPNVINNLGVRTEKVLEAPMISEISTVGYVQFDEDKIVHIHPRVEGWIDTLFVKAEGEPVKRGAPLYTLYSPQLVNAQEEFLIALKRNNKILIQAARERLSALQLSPSFIQMLERSRKVKQSIIFTAKQSGVVDNLKVREGFFVKPGTTIMSIGQLNSVWVEAEVFERDSALVQTGLDVTMNLDYLPGREWHGKIDYVYPTLDPKTRTLRVRLKFENSDFALKPNMFAQVKINASSSENSLLVPAESVIRTGLQNRVVVDLGNGYFKSVAVRLGRVNHQYVEILSGLDVSDSVVISAQFLLDSESSKNSDFKRMSPDSMMTEMSRNMTRNSAMEAHGNSSMQVDSERPSASVKGKVNHIDLANRVLNISREAIDKWDRPATTMDFVLAPEIDINQLKSNDNIHFTFEIAEDFIVTQLHILGTHNVDAEESK